MTLSDGLKKALREGFSFTDQIFSGKSFDEIVIKTSGRIFKKGTGRLRKWSRK